MNRFWLIAAYEYRSNVFKKSFLVVMLSVPLLIALMLSIGFFIERSQENDEPVGYVDHVGVLTLAVQSPEVYSEWVSQQDEAVAFIAYPDEQQAQQALQDGDIQAYFVVAADYHEWRRVYLVYIDPPGNNARRQFYDFLQINLLAGRPEQAALRAVAGTEVIVRSLDGRREVPASAPTFELVLPLIITIALLAMLLTSSGYMLGAVTDEKENRTMEVLTTSVSTFQLIGGKIAGIVAISLTLLVSWILEVVFGIWIASLMGVAWFASPSIDWFGILSILAVAIPGYVLAAALMVALGAVMPSTQDAGSISGIFFILHFAPLYMSWIFIQTPHGPAAVALSLLPFTALVSIGLRNLAAIIPTWQIVASATVQIVCAAGAIWLAARVFRAGMLRYGQRLSLRGVLSRGGRKA